MKLILKTNIIQFGFFLLVLKLDKHSASFILFKKQCYVDSVTKEVIISRSALI